jgi:peroxiredoxin Q/BCP
MTDIAGSRRPPAFDLPVDGGGSISLADLKGKTVVLYFYPKADTPGCTTEGQDFTALAISSPPPTPWSSASRATR